MNRWEHLNSNFDKMMDTESATDDSEKLSVDFTLRGAPSCFHGFTSKGSIKFSL